MLLLTFGKEEALDLETSALNFTFTAFFTGYIVYVLAKPNYVG